MKFNTKVTAVIVLIAVTASLMSGAVLAANDITILINGEKFVPSQKAVFVEKMAFVPMDEVFQFLGATVNWNNDKTKANCLYNGKTVTIDVENSEVIKGGQKIPFDFDATDKNGTIMISLKTVSDSLGCKVIFRGKDRTISISTGKKLMKTHFLDCGDADSIFIEYPDGKCMLVDAGESSFKNSLESFIREKGYDRIDYLVASHPHSDHIGGMSHIVKNFDIGSFYTSNVIHTTQTFENLLTALEDKNLKINLISRGDIIPSSICEVAVLAPEKRQYLRINNYSAVLKIVYNKVSSILCADAEADSEREMMQSGIDLKADVVKIGHHGSFTSTTTGFLKTINPSDAIISVGKDNENGYPSKNIINRLKNKGIKIHRTDEKGNITMVTDGHVYIIVGDK